MVQKKIEALVFAGKVLDDHGGWITIEDKVKKERRFLSRLTQGEILHDGKWVRMDTLSALSSSSTVTPQNSYSPTQLLETIEVSSPDKSAEELTETVAVHVSQLPSGAVKTPEETIDMSIETLAACVEKDTDTSTPEADFPPETAILHVETVHGHEDKVDQPIVDLEGKTQVDIPVDALQNGNVSDYRSEKDKTEFEETVMFSIKTIQAHIDRKNDTNKDANPSG